MRKTIFWLHLITGLSAGAIILIMSATGVAIAFEQEILAWLDRDARTVAAPASGARLPLQQLEAAVAQQRPGFVTTTIIVPRAADEAYEFRAGRDGALYVDPYSGAVREPRSGAAHDLLHVLEDWHRWLGLEGEGRRVGKLITGVCNFAFLLLCLTGLYLWLPRRFTARAFRPIALFAKHVRGSARWFNWHHVFGVWSAVVLIVLAGTGVVFSFAWAHRLVFAAAGEEAPVSRGPGMLAGPPVATPAPPGADARPLLRDKLLANVMRAYPKWESLGVDVGGPGAGPAELFNVVVFEPAPFATRGRTQLTLDAYRGEVLSRIGFEDRSPGTRARIWIRFLHTGEAFGLPGKIIATLATAASLLLIYTGVALSWRRFFGRTAKNGRREDERA